MGEQNYSIEEWIEWLRTFGYSEEKIKNIVDNHHDDYLKICLGLNENKEQKNRSKIQKILRVREEKEMMRVSNTKWVI
jgi:hypothetical protein